MKTFTSIKALKRYEGKTGVKFKNYEIKHRRPERHDKISIDE